MPAPKKRGNFHHETLNVRNEPSNIVLRRFIPFWLLLNLELLWSTYQLLVWIITGRKSIPCDHQFSLLEQKSTSSSAAGKPSTLNILWKCCESLSARVSSSWKRSVKMCDVWVLMANIAPTVSVGGATACCDVNVFRTARTCCLFVCLMLGLFGV